MQKCAKFVGASEESVKYGFLPNRKRINLGVTFSFFAKRKHRKPTQANYIKTPSLLSSLIWVNT